jgi:hypothetical protein
MTSKPRARTRMTAPSSVLNQTSPVGRCNWKSELPAREHNGSRRFAEVHRAAEEPLEFRQLMLARVNEGDLDWLQSNASEKSRTSDQIGHAELDGLSRTQLTGTDEIAFKRDCPRGDLHFDITPSLRTWK